MELNKTILNKINEYVTEFETNNLARIVSKDINKKFVSLVFSEKFKVSQLGIRWVALKGNNISLLIAEIINCLYSNNISFKINILDDNDIKLYGFDSNFRVGDKIESESNDVKVMQKEGEKPDSIMSLSKGETFEVIKTNKKNEDVEILVKDSEGKKFVIRESTLLNYKKV